MFNKILVGLGSLAMLAVIAYLTVDLSKPVQNLTIGTVVKEAVSEQEHYLLYIKEDKEFVADMMTNTVTLVKQITSQPSPVMKLGEGYAKAEYSYFSNTTLIDPQSLNIGIKYSIPTTYESNIEQSSVYLETLLLDGWEIDTKFSTSEYIDLYLNKGQENSRIIILKNYIKIFENVKGKIPNLLTYINE